MTHLEARYENGSPDEVPVTAFNLNTISLEPVEATAQE